VPSILIIHTPDQLEQASNLVDLLETSLALDDDAIACSSLPGYAWRGPTIPFRDASAAIALVDESSVGLNQFWFDLAAAWTTSRRVSVVLGIPELRSTLPVQLQQAHMVISPDRDALRTLIEDLAFDMGVSPRMGRDALDMLDQMSSVPPPPVERSSAAMTGSDLAEPLASAQQDVFPADESPFDLLADVPLPARVPQLVSDGFEEMPELDPLDLVEELESDLPPAPVSRFSQTMTRLRCEVALDAGLTIAECSFHREDGGNHAGELQDTFGRFIDAIGGRWNELVKLGDLELWLGATDNLLESLPSSARAVAEWYEIGFQYATLKCIAEQGLPEDPEAREVYDQMWARSMQQLWESAESAQLPRRETRQVQTQLENVIGPPAYRDYRNLAASLETLRDMARNADRPGSRYARLAGT
jgi:hypothetical protein